MAPNYLTGLSAFLKANTAVAALVSTRIWFPEIPEDQEEAMPQKAILLQPAGGAYAADYILLGEPKVDVRCYAQKLDDCMLIYLAVHDALKAMQRTASYGKLIMHNCTQDGGPLFLREPELNWPFMLSTWTLKASEITQT